MDVVIGHKRREIRRCQASVLAQIDIRDFIILAKSHLSIEQPLAIWTISKHGIVVDCAVRSLVRCPVELVSLRHDEVYHSLRKVRLQIFNQTLVNAHQRDGVSLIRQVHISPLRCHIPFWHIVPEEHRSKVWSGAVCGICACNSSSACVYFQRWCCTTNIFEYYRWTTCRTSIVFVGIFGNLCYNICNGVSC